MKKRKGFLLIFIILSLACGVGFYFYKQQDYSVREFNGLKMKKIDISTFAESDDISTSSSYLSNVKSYQDQLIYMSGENLWKVDPAKKKAKKIELQSIKEDPEVDNFLSHKVKGIEEHYAVVEVSGHFKESHNGDDYTTKYYYGLVDLKTEKQIGQFIEFDSRGLDYVYDSGFLYIQGNGSPNAERSNVGELRQFIIVVNYSENKIDRLFEDSDDYARLYHQYFYTGNFVGEIGELNADGTKQLINNKLGYTVETIKTKKRRNFKFPDEPAENMEAIFGYSDNWVIEEILTYIYAPNDQFESPDVSKLHYYLRNLETEKRKKVDFGKEGPFFMGNDFIRRNGNVMWLSEDKIIKESIIGNTIYRKFYQLPKIRYAALFEKEDGTVRAVTYDMLSGKLLVYDE